MASRTFVFVALVGTVNAVQLQRLSEEWPKNGQHAKQTTKRHFNARWPDALQGWGAGPEVRGKTWNSVNVCDPPAVRSSMPLSIVFGVSKYWAQIMAHRKCRSIPDTAPFVIHVVGAKYPMEARSDWALLSQLAPSNVSKVQVVLSFGKDKWESWLGDGVSQPSKMTGNPYKWHRSEIKDLTGRFVDERIRCAGSMTNDDRTFSKQSFCKNHGKYLSVECHDRDYMDVLKNSKPDFVFIANPDLPRMEGRDWDEPLRAILDQSVPFMVSSYTTQWRRNGPKPGSLLPRKQLSTGAQRVLMAMRAFSVHWLGSYRGPFPLTHSAGRLTRISKNGILQFFQGRTPNAPKIQVPTAAIVKKRKEELFATLSWNDLFGDGDHARKLQSGLQLGASSAYDRAQMEFYFDKLRRAVRRKMIAVAGRKLRGRRRRWLLLQKGKSGNGKWGRRRRPRRRRWRRRRRRRRRWRRRRRVRRRRFVRGRGGCRHKRMAGPEKKFWFGRMQGLGLIGKRDINFIPTWKFTDWLYIMETNQCEIRKFF